MLVKFVGWCSLQRHRRCGANLMEWNWITWYVQQYINIFAWYDLIENNLFPIYAISVFWSERWLILLNAINGWLLMQDSKMSAEMKANLRIVSLYVMIDQMNYVVSWKFKSPSKFQVKSQLKNSSKCSKTLRHLDMWWQIFSIL